MLLKHTGVSVVQITHYREEISPFATDILGLDRGRVVLKRRYENTEVHNLIDKVTETARL